MTVRQTFIIVSMLCFVFVTVSFAETGPAFVMTELKESDKIWPGQQQILYVKLYTTTSFSGSTRFELPGISGMFVMESEDRPVLGSEKIDGIPYISKQHEIMLFPWRPGNVTIPSFRVEFSFRGAEGSVVEQSFNTGKLQFTVGKIPGADHKRPVITTNNLQINDHWDPQPFQAKVGDAFVRTITMTAADLPGMAFPPFPVQKIEGMGIYTKQPQVADKMQRGNFTGKRIETISYVCEQQGTFTIAESQIQWWNPESELLQNIVLEAVVLKVDGNPLLQQERPLPDSVSEEKQFAWKWSLLIPLFSVLVAAAAIWRYRRTKQQESSVQDKENELFKEFQKVSASGDVSTTMQALLHWLDYSNFTGNSGRLSYFVKLADDPELARQVENLETTLYANEHKQAWSSGDRLYSAVQRARKKLKQHKSHGVQYSLPAMNP